MPIRTEPSPQIDQAVRRVNGLFEQYVKLSQSLNYDTMIAAARVDDPAKLSDTIAANLQISVEEKQELLENFDVLDRLNRVAEILEGELEKLNVDRNINSRVKRQMERAQKEYYLNEKLKAIHKELGRGEKNELDDLKKKIDAAGMPKDVREKAVQELKRLEMMPPMSAESTVSRSYLDWLLAVPWKKKSKEIRDIALAEKILEEDHYGFEKIKERILRIPCRAPIGEEPARLDPLSRRAAGRRQDLAGDVHWPRDRPQIRARFPGGRSRRSRNPRPPPHLYRRAARPDHSDDEKGRHD